MDLKLVQIIRAISAIQRLKEMPLSPAIALQVMRALRPINVEVETFEKLRDETIRAYNHIENGYPKVPDDKRAEFNNQMDAVLETKIELPADFKPVPFALITREISSGDLMLLEWLFNFVEPG
jgi:hypothetical protein